MKESDLIALYITFPDKKGRLTANAADRKTIIDLPEKVLSQIKEIILKSLSETNSNDSANNSNNGQDKGNQNNDNQDKAKN